MFAIEFKTQIKDGIVHIPEEYKELYQSEAKIVVLIETEPTHNLSTPNQQLNFFETLRNRHILVDKDVNVDTLMQDMNNGLCW